MIVVYITKFDLGIHFNFPSLPISFEVRNINGETFGPDRGHGPYAWLVCVNCGEGRKANFLY